MNGLWLGTSHWASISRSRRFAQLARSELHRAHLFQGGENSALESLSALHDLVNGGPLGQHCRISCAEARAAKHPNQYSISSIFWCGADGREWQRRDNPLPR
jgi:hypothetical protein